MAKKVALIISLVFGAAYAIFGLTVTATEYNCSGWLCNIGSYLVAEPWSKVWDAGGPLFTLNILNKAILNGLGAIINSVIIFFIFFYIIKLIFLGINKLKG
jgi:hypothetical protein